LVCWTILQVQPRVSYKDVPYKKSLYILKVDEEADRWLLNYNQFRKPKIFYEHFIKKCAIFETYLVLAWIHLKKSTEKVTVESERESFQPHCLYKV